MDIEAYALAIEERLLVLVRWCFNTSRPLQKLATVIAVDDRLAATAAGWNGGHPLELELAVWLMLVRLRKAAEAASRTLLARFVPKHKEQLSALRTLEAAAHKLVPKTLLLAGDAADAREARFRELFDDFLARERKTSAR